MSIGANIKTRRLALNMTQKELADLVHVAQAMISQVERGTKVPTLPLGAEIAEALGCGVEELIQ